TPDAHTLVVQLTQPTGDLGYRFAMPATAPIPPNPYHPAAALGIASGHDRDYGRYLVSSGPYMYPGSEDLNFSVPPRMQRPVATFVPNRTIQLVRNPSWHGTADRLRPAYVDGIQISIGDNARVVANQVDQGKVDFAFSDSGSPQWQL